MCGESLDHRPSVLEVVGVISLHLPQVEGHMHVDGSIGGSEGQQVRYVSETTTLYVGWTDDRRSESKCKRSVDGWLVGSLTLAHILVRP